MEANAAPVIEAGAGVATLAHAKQTTAPRFLTKLQWQTLVCIQLSLGSLEGESPIDRKRATWLQKGFMTTSEPSDPR